ncbi:uncharacterized protein LOC123684331 [Harmonia axyridis]|uniref:uncharacterized protein LOC123684331 n=1 Tax=Harmonia axyridis TaxID=115357 RepID=UPI001E275F78|nr:uncharacterized protein LOC123684331 [Harmonia axyridis]
MITDLHFMSFTHNLPTDSEMFSELKISVFFALVFAAIVSANERSKRSGLGDLGSSVLLPWQSSNVGGLRNNIYRTVPGSEVLRVRNIDNQNLNGQNELQQRQRDLVRLSSAYESRELNQPQSAINSDSIQDSLKQYTIGREGQRGLQQQNGYSALGAYSLFDSNPSTDENPALNGETGQRQSQYLDLSRNQLITNQLPQQSLDGSDDQSNIQLNKIIPLGGQPNRYYNQALINSNRFNRYSQLPGLGQELSGVNAEENNSLRYLLSKVVQSDEELRQRGLRNSGRIVSANVLEQNAVPTEALKQFLVRGNQEPAEQATTQQNNQDSIQEVNESDDAQRLYQSLRTLGNGQVNRPVAQDSLPSVYNRQYPLEDARIPQRQSAQLQVGNSNSENLARQLQNQGNVNQQQGNSYTYGELSAKIWNVIKSNPAMMSNLDNLREQLLNGNNSGNEQMGQLKSLLQEARNRNIFIPRNIVGSPEEQERNIVVNNLIGAMNRNNILSNRLSAKGQGLYRGWRV